MPVSMMSFGFLFICVFPGTMSFTWSQRVLVSGFMLCVFCGTINILLYVYDIN